MKNGYARFFRQRFWRHQPFRLSQLKRQTAVDGDGIVTISDATEIQRYLAEMDVPEEIGKPIK